ncbi:16S rRNA (uracil(1498)-N(3))-methyltransferase [Ekhidna sp.]|uniref:16S rRNA (uracil(1498)-N(3))-methyltransferase n=1 Tax=Ekhidna sp. TaxID=2608089 RepID=UPI003B596F53
MTIFYEKGIKKGVNRLSEDESKHCAQVLRHQVGDEILIFDGNGAKHHAVLTSISKKACEFEITSTEESPGKNFSIHLAIAPTKNMDRMEWLIEKLCEIGADEVTFIQTKHSERKKLRMDRLEKKAISAMKQSGNPFLLRLNELTDFKTFINGCQNECKLIAHVDKSHNYIQDHLTKNSSVAMLIGPEGDFSKDEVTAATQSGFKPVSLGHNTLRTETAGFVACCIVNFVNQF